MRRLTSRSVPLALFVGILLSFGLLIPWLGFFWDDWPAVWFYHTLGPQGLREAFTVDRPLLGWIFWITARIGRESPFAWQTFALLTRWTSAAAFWALLRSLWPERKRLAAWAGLFFAVYPGFTQQPIAVTYSSAWLILTAFLASLILTVLSTRRRYLPLTAAALALAAFAMFSTEYFFGLELLRPVLIYLVLTENRPEVGRKISWPAARETILRWLPYIALMLVFLYWRLVLRPSPRGDVQVFEQLGASPLGALLHLLSRVIGDTLRASLLAWAQVFNPLDILRGGPAAAALATLVALIAGAMAFLYLRRFRPGEEELTGSREKTHAGGRAALLLGGLSLLVAGLPFWMTDLPVGLSFPWDRFTLAFMFGTSLVLAGALLSLRWRRAAVLLAAVLIGLAAGRNIDQTNQYRRDWNLQADYFWQLAWRAPGIEPGTVLLTAELPFRYFTDNSLTAPLNWMYLPDLRRRELGYLLYDAEARLGKGLEGFTQGQEIFESYRSTPFTGSTSQALVVYYSPPGCVRVADPEIDQRLPQKPRFYDDALPLSDLGLIRTDGRPVSPPASIFGLEPARGWCYYFEKGDLARQQANWEEVARLGDAAFAPEPRLYAVNAPELIPYIEGYARTGNWERAAELSLQAHELTWRMERMLCDNWQRILESTPESPARSAAFQQTQEQYQCEP